MTTGVYMLCYGGLLAVVALAVPLPVGPRALGDGPAPAAGTPPRCLALHVPSEATHRHGPLPARLRLDAGPRDQYGWRPAAGGRPHDLAYHAAWRPAGADSIDIRWHHSPVIRLAARGPRRGGFVLPAWPASLVHLMLEPPPVAITAEEAPCDAYPAAAS